MKHLISIIALAAAAASAAAAVKTPMQAEVKVADPQARALVSKLVVERSQNILFVKADLSTAPHNIGAALPALPHLGCYSPGLHF